MRGALHTGDTIPEARLGRRVDVSGSSPLKMPAVIRAKPRPGRAAFRPSLGRRLAGAFRPRLRRPLAPSGRRCGRTSPAATTAPASAIAAGDERARPRSRPRTPRRRVVRPRESRCGDHDRAHERDPERAAHLAGRVQHGRADARLVAPARRASPRRRSASSSAPCPTPPTMSPGSRFQKVESGPSREKSTSWQRDERHAGRHEPARADAVGGLPGDRAR